MTFDELIAGGLHILCLFGQDATLCAASGKSGKVETTALYRQLYEAAGDIKPKNIIDRYPLPRLQRQRHRPRAGLCLRQSHSDAGNGGRRLRTVLSHPSLAGITSGSGISGSTAWHGAFRFRMYLTSIKPEAGEQPDGDIRALQFRKNQYGPMGEAIALRYQRGLFLPEQGMSSLDKLAREQKAEETFLTLLARLGREGRNVSDKPTRPGMRRPPSPRRRRPKAFVRTTWPPPCAACLPPIKFTSSSTDALGSPQLFLH